MRILSYILACYASISFSYALTTKQAGDIGRYAIPLTSAGISLCMLDFEGIFQLGLSAGIVQGATEGLKALTDERRPNGGCCNSFPSGHTSSAFTGASYIQFRYGALYSIPFYAAATYVAYSRVHVQAHYVHDVLAGAALGIVGTYLSTTKYMDDEIFGVANGQYAGIIWRKIFD